MKALLPLIILITSVGPSCSESDGIAAQFPEQVRLLAANAPVYSIDLDDVTVRTVYVDSLSFRYSGQDSTLVVASPTHVLVFGERLLVTDRRANHVIVLDTNREVVGVIGRPGEGPGEFSVVGSLATNGRTLFVLDTMKRVQLFNRQLGFVSALPVSGFDEPIVAFGNSILVPAGQSPSHAILLLSDSAPHDSVSLQLPRLAGLPCAANMYSASADTMRRELCVAYRALPLLLCLDQNLQHAYSVELTGTLASDHLHRFIIEDGPGSEGVRGFVISMVHLGDSLMGFVHKNVLYVIRKKDKGVELVDALILQREGRSSDRPLPMGGLAYDGVVLYDGSANTGQVYYATVKFGA